MTFCHAQGIEAGNECSPLFWHLQNSVPERASSGTEYARRAQKGFLRYATRFLKPSVLKTGFWGTDGIFGTGNTLLRYATHPQRRKTADSQTVDSLLPYRTHFQRRRTASCCTECILGSDWRHRIPNGWIVACSQAEDWLYWIRRI